MFKKFVCLLVVCFSLFADGSVRSGTDIAGYAQKAQHEGTFKSDLENLHSCYCKKKEKHAYDKALLEKKDASVAIKNSHVAPSSKKRMEFELKKADLDATLSKNILQSLAATNDERAVSIKKSLAFEPTHAQSKALEYFDSLKHSFLGEGKSPLETELIKVHTEYFLKEHELAVGDAYKKLQTSPEFHATLELSKWDAMQEAAFRYPKTTVAKHVFQMHAMAPLLIAKKHDMTFLSNLGRNTVDAKLEWEQNVQSIMQTYFASLQKLEQQYLNQ